MTVVAVVHVAVAVGNGAVGSLHGKTESVYVDEMVLMG